ncbi:DUF2486 family protein [Paraburkholderia sp. MMS20-SJTR3]|uniref:DUF2486 family protein n=1 Tax=Paraburkholderia sejongensis TaxID=2886946 RepID=A0ABS8JPB0_9BURK|nr:DUF2486 family protein [Paraburkholderia sp. MMS20-SJTR3]MCC8391741.1 DUF2486 family protein [Paraburkholderia sp. MMS20-SJTR3]
MSDPNDHSIPLLQEIIQPGRAPRTGDASGASAAPDVFDRSEPSIPLEAGATVPPDIGGEGAHDAATHPRVPEAAAAQPELDADALAERLCGRLEGFLAGEGRGLIDARCRDAVQQHTNLLVARVTREVARVVEAELSGWVREAVREELARHAGRA